MAEILTFQQLKKKTSSIFIKDKMTDCKIVWRIFEKTAKKLKLK